MSGILPYHGSKPLEIAVLVLFAVLFAWISAGFWTALAGFWLLPAAKTATRFRASAVGTGPTDIPADARTAIVMPICNEDVRRVFAGLRATYESLAQTGALERFDFYVLSDTGNADTRVAELDAWLALCRARRRLRPHVLPVAPAPHQAQERQHRRFLPPLGKKVPLHDRPRCGQRDERRLPDVAGAHRRSESRRRHHPDRAARGRARHAVRARPAVRDRRLRTAVHRRTAFLAVRRIALLGPQRDHSRRAVHSLLRDRPLAGTWRAVAARSCRTTSSKPR